MTTPSLRPRCALPLRQLALAGLATLAGLVAACSFDAARLDALPRCAPAGGCADPGLRCVSGYCVAPAAPAADLGPAASDAGLPPGDLGPAPRAALSLAGGGLLGDQLELDGSESEGDGLEFFWHATDPAGDARSPLPLPGEPARANLRLLSPGEHTVWLELRDRHGRSASSELRRIEVPGYRVYARSGLADLSPDNAGGAWVAGLHGAQHLDAQGRWTALSELSCERVERVGAGAAFAASGGESLWWVPGPGPDSGGQAIALPGIQRVRGLRARSSEELWVAGAGGLRVVDTTATPPTVEILTAPDDERDLRSLLPVDEGTWLAQRSALCFWLGPGDPECRLALALFPELEGAETDAAVLDLLLDGQGRLVVSTDGLGLRRRTESSPFGPVAPSSAALRGRLSRMAAEPGGDLWLVSDDALLRVGPDDEVISLPVPAGGEALGPLRSLGIEHEPRRVWLLGELGVATLEEREQ